jgi:hypothetical protein
MKEELCMNLNQYVTNTLYQMFKDQRDAGGRLKRDGAGYTWHGSHEHHAIQLEFGEPDRHSTELYGLQVVTVRPAEESVPGLHMLAEEIIERLSYLEEPLAVWELEEREKTVQLRSQPPLFEEDAVFYWEVTIQQAAIAMGLETTVHIGRYHWQPGMPERDVVCYPATYALVGRIASSLALG